MTYTYIENISILLMTIIFCGIFFYLSSKKIFKPFLPKYLTTLIERNKPTYYDINGHIIDKPQPNKTVSQPIYNFEADTTATITTKGIKAVEDETVKVQPSVVSEVLQTKEKTYMVYCMKCKEKKELKNVTINKLDTSKGVKFFAKGTCTTCNNPKCSGFIKG